MNLQEFFSKTNKVIDLENSHYRFQEIRPRIICQDGVSLSVQGSETHYCQPRINDYANYYEVEVGYPSIRPPETWKQYFDGEWQQIGIIGWIKRVWKERSSIFYSLKNLKGLGKWRIEDLFSFKDNATRSVYGYIPTKLIEEFLNSHGGIDEKETFKKSTMKE